LAVHVSERFFSSLPILGDRATLDGPEAHHLSHVMRAATGDRVTLFDGSGAEFEAVVERMGRSAVELRVLERREVDRELPFPLVVGVALPKGDRQKWLVEKLTELGVTELAPLVTERGVAQSTAGALERLQRTVIEACKQCGRNRLMRIAEPRTWSELISAPPTSESSRRLLAHPGGTPLAAVDMKWPQPTQLAIGPEGGLSDAEVSAATAAGWQAIDLGPRILRVETAAIALAAAVALTATSPSFPPPVAAI
jgi:16S rRNA (uracil1498-N3)-methyltransferase